MKITQRLNTPVKSIRLNLALLVGFILSATTTFAVSYLLANRLVGGSASFQSFIPLETNRSETKEENINPEDLPELIESGLGDLDWEPVPDTALTPWDGTSRVTILVMGLDYRDWSAGEGPSRTDTMMLLTMDPLDNTAGMLSIPRDLWVSIPGFENGRINTAYFLGESFQTPGGGPGLAVKTVEQLLGIPINYYAQIDFGAFIRFVEEIDGVKVDVPASIRIDPIEGKPIYLDPGRQTLNGEQTLAYARARNSEGGDLDRALRQQQVIFGIRDRLLKPESLTGLIAKAPVLYGEISSGIRTNMGLEEAIKLALLAQKVPEEKIMRGAISSSEIIFAESPDGQSVLIPLPENIRQLRDQIFLVSTGTFGPLLPGTQAERMATEAARIVLLNGSLQDGLAARTNDYLTAQGANVVEIGNGEFTNTTRIVDFTGNPHTVQYLSELMGLQSGYYELRYDPTSSVDIVVTLGSDWSVPES